MTITLFERLFFNSESNKRVSENAFFVHRSQNNFFATYQGKTKFQAVYAMSYSICEKPSRPAFPK